MVLYNTFNENLDELMFNHNMECLYLEQNIVNNVLQLRYNGIVNTESTEIINEGVFETIKNAVLAVFKKIKELFMKVADFVRKEKHNEDNKKLEKEIEKAKDIVADKPIIKKNTETSDNTSSSSSKDITPSQVFALPSFTTRTIELYRNCNPITIDTLTYTVNNCELRDRIFNAIDFEIEYDDEDDDISVLQRGIKRRRDKTDKRANDTTEQKKLAYNFFDCFASYLFSGHFKVKFALNEDNYLSFPSSLRESINKYATEKINNEYSNFSNYKTAVKIALDLAQRNYEYNSESDYNKAKTYIDKMEKSVYGLKKIGEDDMRNLLKLTNMLSSLLNSIVPVKIKFEKRMSDNSRYNLRILNSIIEKDKYLKS